MQFSMVRQRNGARILLVGCVHRDPEGYQRLLELLEAQRPDCLTVEISPYSIRFRKKHGRSLFRKFSSAVALLPEAKRAHPSLRLVVESLKIPYEWRAAEDYAKRFSIPCKAIDVSWVSRKHLPLFSREMLRKKNLEILSEGDGFSDPVSSIRNEYLYAQKIIENPESYANFYKKYFEDSLDRLREKIVAKRIRSLVEEGRRLIHIAGWLHLISSHEIESLAAFLRDLEPERILLRSVTGDQGAWSNRGSSRGIKIREQETPAEDSTAGGIRSVRSGPTFQVGPGFTDIA